MCEVLASFIREKVVLSICIAPKVYKSCSQTDLAVTGDRVSAPVLRGQIVVCDLSEECFEYTDIEPCGNFCSIILQGRDETDHHKCADYDNRQTHPQDPSLPVLKGWLDFHVLWIEQIKPSL